MIEFTSRKGLITWLNENRKIEILDIKTVNHKLRIYYKEK